MQVGDREQPLLRPIQHAGRIGDEFDPGNGERAIGDAGVRPASANADKECFR